MSSEPSVFAASTCAGAPSSKMRVLAVKLVPATLVASGGAAGRQSDRRDGRRAAGDYCERRRQHIQVSVQRHRHRHRRFRFDVGRIHPREQKPTLEILRASRLNAGRASR